MRKNFLIMKEEIITWALVFILNLFLSISVIEAEGLNPKLIWSKSYKDIRDVIVDIKTNEKGEIEPCEVAKLTWDYIYTYDRDGNKIGEISLKLNEEIKIKGNSLQFKIDKESSEAKIYQIKLSKGNNYIFEGIDLGSFRVLRYYDRYGNLLWRKGGGWGFKIDYGGAFYISENGDRIYVSASKGNVNRRHKTGYVVYDRNGNEIKELMVEKVGQMGIAIGNLVFSPDGRYWAYTTTNEYVIGRGDEIVGRIKRIEEFKKSRALDMININNNGEFVVHNYEVNKMYYFSNKFQVIWKKNLKSGLILFLHNTDKMLLTVWKNKIPYYYLIKRDGRCEIESKRLNFESFIIPYIISGDDKYILYTAHTWDISSNKKYYDIENNLKLFVLNLKGEILWEYEPERPDFTFERCIITGKFYEGSKYLLVKVLYDIGEFESVYKRKGREIRYYLWKLK